MSEPGTPALGPTYRIQLSPRFGFEQTEQVVAYLADLGIAYAYLSPVFEARAGSEHGYDVVDPTRVRRQLGGRAGLESLAAALHRAGLKVLADVVPNHLSTDPAGPWWRQLLRHGRSSPAAAIFDVDWEAPGCDGRVILPVLAAPLEEVLDAGELTLATAPDGPVVCHGGRCYPLRPDGPPPGAPLEQVLAAQHYVLSCWRDPARNYRRFFAIDDLVGVRQEDPEVFSLTHRLLGELVSAGTVDAVRVDHLDGLADPAGYLEALGGIMGGRPVVVEKILTAEEPLRAAWPIAGTTGYESADDLTHALGDPTGLARLAAAAEAEGEPPEMAVVGEAKAFVLERFFSSEVARVARATGLGERRVAEAAAAMPVYRTYVSAGGGDELDSLLLTAAGGEELAELVLSPLDRPFLEGVLGFQQLCAAAMAKGVEDTAWYRLVSNLPFLEVGGDPHAGPARDGVARLHRRAAARLRRHEHGLVAGTTHDTKRSADVRARLLALAAVAPYFEAGLAAFAEAVPGRPVGDGRPPVPGPLERRRVAETCLAMAPGPRAAPGEWEEVADRVEAALRKGAREARTRDSWEQVNEAYEEALAEPARALCADSGRLLRTCFGPAVGRVQRFGATLSLAEVVLRSSLPGVPDCYQGDEVWNLALVDPDNRRPVDFARLARRLGELPDPDSISPAEAAALRRSWPDGRVKLLVTRQCLHARALQEAAFAPGAGYVPLGLEGARDEPEPPVIALARSAGSSLALAVATRAPERLAAEPGDLPVGEAAFSSAAIFLPGEIASMAGGGLRDVLSGARVEARSGRLALAEVLAALPVALLVPLGAAGGRG